VWFFDDGHNVFNPVRGKKHIWLYTNGLLRSDVEKLIAKIKLLGISNAKTINSGKKRKNLPQVYIGAKSYFDFLEIVTPHNPCNCMDYKCAAIKHKFTSFETLRKGMR
jgi:hypothetical protein